LLVIADITETVDAERRLESKHDLLALFEHFTSDPSAFRRAMVELDRLVRASLAPPRSDRIGTAYAHRLHTLKGCASMYGLTSLVNRTHVIEDEWGQMGEVKAASLEDLRRIWDEVELRVQVWMQTERTLVVTEPELRRIEQSVREGATPVALAMLERLAWERVDRRLAEQAVRLADLAAQLGKLEPEVVVDAQDVRVPPDFCAELWSSLVHVLKNAVDHGIEEPATRARLGKPERGKVVLAARADERVLEVEVRDDGRGIDWSNVREKAKARGLPTSRRSDLVDALFSEGLSTREEVTQVSGRGIGTAAVRHIVERHGGRVLVDSELGRWTSFRFVLPLPGADDLPATDEVLEPDEPLELLTG
jgi:two-component system chemotaxis sensor kinase CheA